MNKQIHNNKQTNCKQTSKEVIIKEITKKKKHKQSTTIPRSSKAINLVVRVVKCILNAIIILKQR